MRPESWLAAAIAAIVLSSTSACAVGPDYRAPQTPMAATFASAESGPYASGPAVAEFWKEFQDPDLEALIVRALEANHDLRVADARLAEARALRGEARFDLAPTVTANARYEHVRFSGDEAAARGGSRDYEFYRAGLDAAWEVDLFGRIRRGIEASDAGVGAARATRRAVSVAVASEVARNYLELRGLQLRQAVAERNLRNQRETLELAEARLKAGRGTELDTSRARAQLETTSATLPALDTALAATRHRLAVLTGLAPTALDGALAARKPLPQLPDIVAVGKPEDWLRNRPDVARAERALAGATAQVGVAVADLFPRITLLGSFGSGAVSFDGLGDAGSDAYSLVPGIHWAAFDLGRVRARIAASEARTDAALALYQQTVLTALEETENALTGYRNALLRRHSLEQSVDASGTAARLARARYDAGVADFLAVLDAERTQLEAEDRLAGAQAEAGTRLVALYKALGAGWDAGDAFAARREPVP